MTAPTPHPAAAPPAAPPLTPLTPLTWRQAVGRFPPSYVLLLGVVGAFGLAAGALALPLFLWTTPPIVALLLAGAAQAIRRSPPPPPVAAAASDRSAATPSLNLPRDVRPLVDESLERLTPGGAARGLLEDVACLAATLHAAMSEAATDRRRGLLPRAWRVRAAGDAHAGDGVLGGGVGELV